MILHLGYKSHIDLFLVNLFRNIYRSEGVIRLC